MKKILFGILLLLASPSFATTKWIPVNQAIEDSAPGGTTCATPALQTGKDVSYWYALCQDDATWSGTMQWKFTDIIPYSLKSPNVHFKVAYETLTVNTGGNQDISFNIGGVVQDDSCNTATDKTYCDLTSSAASEPTLSYETTGTNSGSNSKCVGQSVAEGGNTADGATCTTQAGCTTTGQVCVSQVQYTARAAGPYTLQKVQSGGDTLTSCSGTVCAGMLVEYTVEVDATETTIERDFRVLALGVEYDYQ